MLVSKIYSNNEALKFSFKDQGGALIRGEVINVRGSKDYQSFIGCHNKKWGDCEVKLLQNFVFMKTTLKIMRTNKDVKKLHSQS